MEQYFSSVLANLRHSIAAKYAYAKSITNREDISEVYLFISSNQRENLTQNEAIRMISSPEHKLLRFLVAGYAELDGNKITLLDALGEWSDGIENSLLAIIESKTDIETAKAYAASAGKVANQKSVLLFYVIQSQIKDLLFHLSTITDHDISALRNLIRSSGNDYSTVLPRGSVMGHNNYEIVVCCSGESCRLPVSNLAISLGDKNTTLIEKTGLIEFFGADTRAEASELFAEHVESQRRRHKKRVNALHMLNSAHSKALETANDQEKAMLNFPLVSDKSRGMLDQIFGVSNLTENQYLDLLLNTDEH